MKHKFSIVLAVLICLLALSSEAVAKYKFVNMKAVHFVIKADLCKDWKPSKHSPNCLFSDKWVSMIDLDNDSTPEFLLKTGFPWSMPGAVEDLEFRIYQIQDSRLVRIFQGLGSAVSVLQDVTKMHKMPNLIAAGKNSKRKEWVFTGKVYRLVGQFVSKFDTPRKAQREFKAQMKKRAKLRYDRANRSHFSKEMQKHCDQDCGPNRNDCIICGC